MQRLRFRPPVLLPLLLCACIEGVDTTPPGKTPDTGVNDSADGSDTGAGTDSGTDTGTDTETDTETDTGTGTDSGTGSDSAIDSGTEPDSGTDTGAETDTGDTGSASDPCVNPYDPVDVTGGFREYAVTMVGSTGTSFHQLYAGAGGAYVIGEETYVGGDASSMDTYVSCQASGTAPGMYIDAWSGTFAGTPPTVPVRYLPNLSAMGTTGSWTYAFTSDVDPLGLGLMETYSVAGTFREIGFESVSLWSAPVDAYHISHTFTTASSSLALSWTIDRWYVEGLGIVREVIMDDASGTTVLERDLVSYGGGLAPAGAP